MVREILSQSNLVKTGLEELVAESYKKQSSLRCVKSSTQTFFNLFFCHSWYLKLILLELAKIRMSLWVISSTSFLLRKFCSCIVLGGELKIIAATEKKIHLRWTPHLKLPNNLRINVIYADR